MHSHVILITRYLVATAVNLSITHYIDVRYMCIKDVLLIMVLLFYCSKYGAWSKSVGIHGHSSDNLNFLIVVLPNFLRCGAPLGSPSGCWSSPINNYLNVPN